jgi:hypothetical protein
MGLRHTNLSWKEKNLDYEIETPSTVATQIQGSNSFVGRSGFAWGFSWKEKNLDYEIETPIYVAPWPDLFVAWKEKNLDYEIETPIYVAPWPDLFVAWKEKNLDYEIETVLLIFLRMVLLIFLEKKRTSITRLKLAC